MRRLLLCYGAAILFIIFCFAVVAAMPIAIVFLPLVGVLLGFVLLASYYVLFLRLAIGGLSLNRLDFRFTARSADMVKLALGDLALLVLTLGIGFVFLSYRHWAFLIRHLEASGEVELASLTQSTTEEPKQGEGLLDAFDVGAF